MLCLVVQAKDRDATQFMISDRYICQSADMAMDWLSAPVVVEKMLKSTQYVGVRSFKL
jgi:hypothetical protein